MMNKKGQTGIVAGIILATISLLLIANLLVPQAQTLTQSTTVTDSGTLHTLGAGNTVITLDQASSVVTNSLSVANGSTTLTLTNNYTVDYDSGKVTILNATANGTYSPTYEYGVAYLESSGDRALASVIVLGAIIGLLYLVFRVFGVA